MYLTCSGHKLFSLNRIDGHACAHGTVLVVGSVCLKAESSKGKRSDFDHYLSMVPDVPAQAGDEVV